MARVPSDELAGLVVEVWPEYQKIVNKAEGKEVGYGYILSRPIMDLLIL